jgi:hypothetical protein
MSLIVPAHLSHTGKSHRKMVAVDECIFSIVKALNAGGVPTEDSCCGHGKQLGSIILSDGRVLMIVPDFKTAIVEAYNGGQH